MALFAIFTCVNFSSCGDDDDFHSDYNPGKPSVDLSNYVSVSVRYHDYAWFLNIDNRLKEAFPNDNIKLGVAIGYNGVPIDFYKYYYQTGNFEAIEPLYIDTDGSPYVSEYIYWKSYMALKDKGYLDSWDQELLDELKISLDESESSAYNTFWGIIFASFNGEKQIIRTFGQQRMETDDEGGSSGGNSDGSPSYEKPDVSFYDYSATRNSLNVKFKIYNRDEAKVSSAKIYYGTSRNPSTPVSTSVSGVMINGNIKGLKPGTTYYVKCVAKGRGGQMTTEVTKCMTLY